MSNKINISKEKEKKIKGDISQSKAINFKNQPASDIYSDIKCKDPETGVEVPTEEAVEEAKKWVDENRQT